MREFTSPAPPGQETGNPLEGIKFTLDGVEFQCHGRMSVLETALLASAVTEDSWAGNGTGGMAAVADFLRVAFGDEEFHRFRVHARTHNTSDHTILEIMDSIRMEVEGNSEALTDRPTPSQSGSSLGPLGLDERTSLLARLPDGDTVLIPHQATQDGLPVDKARAQELADQAASRAAVKGARKSRANPRPTSAQHRTIKLG